MRSKDLEKLVGSYVKARLGHGETPETVRLLRIAPPTDRELRYGHVSNRIHVRRFLLGGWIDTWVLPRDVVEATDPTPSVLAAIKYVEDNVGEKPKRAFA